MTLSRRPRSKLYKAGRIFRDAHISPFADGIGLSATVDAAQAKKFATAAAVSGLVTCMQAMGANGFLIDSTLGRHLATAKMAEYLDGTSEIQNVVVRSLFGGAFGRIDLVRLVPGM